MAETENSSSLPPPIEAPQAAFDAGGGGGYPFGAASLDACSGIELVHSLEKHIPPFWTANWIERFE